MLKHCVQWERKLGARSGLPRAEEFPRHGTFYAKTAEVLYNLGHVGHSRCRLWSLVPLVCFSDDYYRGLTGSSGSAVLCLSAAYCMCLADKNFLRTFQVRVPD